MKRAILRNVAIVSAIFALAFSVMLVTNYFQVRGTTPLQTEVVETLKQLNDSNADSPELQAQIRQLDLLARRAYFVSYDHLMIGIYILLGMLAVFVISLRLYYSGDKDIPDKDIDAIDEWAIKTNARRNLVWAAVGIAAIGIVFVALSGRFLSGTTSVKTVENVANEEVSYVEEEEPAPAEDDAIPEQTADTPEPKPAEPELPKTDTNNDVTHNGFRGNNSNGISTAKGIPVKWNPADGTNIAWKKSVPRKGFNSPVINAGKIYFSGADEQARELFCYDLATGEKLWSVEAKGIPGSPAQMPKTTDDTGLAASSVATNGKQTCAIFATGDIICSDASGKLLWAKNLGVPDNHYGYASSLLIFGNTVIIQYDNHNSPRIIALDLATGAERWTKIRSDKVAWSSPIIAYVDSKPELVLMGTPAITAYNPSSGEQLWRLDCMTGEVGSSPCSANGIVFGASEYAKLVAINAIDGKQIWESNEYLPEVSSPVATKENVYVATSYGVFAAFDANTGELRKQHELNTEFYSSPIIVEGKIYLFDNDGKMYIFSADSNFNLLAQFDTGERTFATPAFTDGRIVVRTESSIYCVSAK
jgi:outer membrane protein assembly factor BamB